MKTFIVVMLNGKSLKYTSVLIQEKTKKKAKEKAIKLNPKYVVLGKPKLLEKSFIKDVNFFEFSDTFNFVLDSICDNEDRTLWSLIRNLLFIKCQQHSLSIKSMQNNKQQDNFVKFMDDLTDKANLVTPFKPSEEDKNYLKEGKVDEANVNISHNDNNSSKDVNSDTDNANDKDDDCPF